MGDGVEFRDGVERDEIWSEQKNIVVVAQLISSFQTNLIVNIKEGAKDRYFNREHTRNWLLFICLEWLH